MTHNTASTAGFGPFQAADAVLDVNGPLFRDIPHGRLDDARHQALIDPDPAAEGIVLTRAGDVTNMLADHALSSNRWEASHSGLIHHTSGAGEGSEQSMDAGNHRRLRALLSKVLSAGAIEAMRPTVEQMASNLLDSVDSHQPFDLIAELATPLPVLVITALLGLDQAHVLQVKLWSDAMMAEFAPDRADDAQQRLEAARDGFNDLLLSAIEERRRAPRDDLLSTLAAAEQDGSKLTETEILNACRPLLVAGNITTTDLIGNGIVALLRHPDQLAKLRADGRLMTHAVEEILRYDPPVVAITRQPKENRQIQGCSSDAGQSVTAMLLAANHDPALHREPHRFDVGRTEQRYFSFGGGAHACIGASLARLETEIALRVVVDRFPHLRLAPDCTPQRKAHPGSNGFAAVWVTSQPA